MKVRVPPPVEPGGRVAIVSPSFGAVGRWPHRTERGIAYLESLGLSVKLMPNAALDTGYLAGTPQERVDDIHAAFADDSVSLILAGIGGNHSNQLLPLLDYDLIGANPKWFQGYSDMTVLHWALLKHAALATFYGPALISELGEFPQVFHYTDHCLRSAWFANEPLVLHPAEAWTEEFLDWDERADLERARRMTVSEGWVTVRGGEVEGPILGGCLETICWHLKGSAAWVEPDGTIFFLETSEEAPSPEHVDAYLVDLEQLGVFDRCNGLLIGRPRGYSDAERAQLWDVVAARTERSGIPVLANIDCAHTDPMLTLPLGVPTRLDATTRSLSVMI